MRLTTMTDYAMRLLMYVAHHPDRLCMIAEIAEAYGVSEAHRMKVTHQLGVAGFIETVGGTPGWFLHDDDVESFAPHPQTQLGVESIFTGDYKGRNVVSVGIDLRSFWYYQDISSRYLKLFLMNSGTCRPRPAWRGPRPP